MAYNNQKRTIDYEIQFKTNQQSLRNVANAFQKMTQNLSFSELQIINKSSIDQARTDLLTIQQTANQVEDALTAAFNPKLGITNIEAFKNNLSQAGLSIQQVRQNFELAGGAGTAAFQSMANSLTNVRLKATESASIIDRMSEGLKRSLGWTAASTVINRVTGSIQEAYGYVKHLDTSLNDIRIVTEYSAEAMDKFAEKANKAAISLGKSTTDYTEAALIYYQQGLGEEDVEARTNVTLKTANVTQQSTAEVSEQLTAIWNGYKVNAEEAEAYIDKVAKVAATTAADLEEMATGMSKVASAANVMGVDIDQMNAILATTISVTRQAPESVGAAYKTIFARMSTIQAGEETEDGATLTSYTEKMAALGVSALDTNGKLRDMGDIIEEVGEKWSDWGREQQIAFAQVAAGTRQYNNLIALFDNWDMYKQSLEESRNAMGTLQTQQDIYMESTAAHLQQLRTAAEGVYDSLLNPKDINTAVDGLTEIVKGIEPVVDGLGGIKGMLSMIAPLMMQAFSKDIGNALGQTFSNFNIKAENQITIDNLKNSILALGDAADPTTQKYMQMKNELADMSKFISPEKFNELAQGIYNAFEAESQEIEAANKLKDAKEQETKAEQEATKAREALTNATNALNQAENKNFTTSTDAEQHLKQKAAIAESDYNKAQAQFQQAEARYNQNPAISTFNQIYAGLGKGQQTGNQQQIQYYQNLLNAANANPDLVKSRDEAEKEYERYENALERAKQRLDTNNQVLKDYQDKINNATKATGDLTNAEQEVSKAKDAHNAATSRLAATQGISAKITKEEFNQLGQSISLISSAVMSINSIRVGIQNLDRVLQDETIPLSEKVFQVLTNGTMVLSQGVNAVLNFKKGFEGISGVIDKTIPIGNGAANTFLGISSTAGAATISVGTLMLTIAALVAAIAAWIWAAKRISEALEDVSKTSDEAAEVLDNANKTLEQQKVSAQEAATALADLKSSLENLSNQEDKLDELAKGTEEWNNQLQEVNNSILGLIEKYPQLSKYLQITNGQYSIQQEGLDELQESLENNAKIAKQGVLQGQINQRQAEKNLAISTFAEKAGKEGFYKSNAYEETDRGILGASPIINKLGWRDKQTDDFYVQAKYDIDWTSEEEINNKRIDAENQINNLKEEYLKIQEAIKTQEYSAYQYTLEDLNEIENQLEILESQVDNYDEILRIKQQYKDIDLERLKITQAIIEEEQKGYNQDFRKNTSDNYTSKQQDFIINAAEGYQARVYNNILDNLNSKDNKDQILTEYYQKQYGISDSGFTEKDGVQGVYDNYGNFITKQSLETEYVLKQLDELGIKYDDIIHNIYSGDKGLARAIVDSFNQGTTTIADISQNEIELLQKVYGETDTNTKNIIDLYERANEKIANSFATTSEKNAYTRLRTTDFDSLTIDQREQLAAKIHEAYLEGGKEGVNDLVDLMNNTDFETAITLTIKTPEEDLTQALKDAGVKEADFRAEKAYREASGQNYDDQVIINYLAAQKKLNNLYKDRENIFKSLAGFEWETATSDQKQYITDLKQAFDALTGSDISLDKIKEKLPEIERYLNGDADAAKELGKAFLALTDEDVKEKFENINQTFQDYAPKVKLGETINSDLKTTIDKIAKELNLTDKEIKQLYSDYGYDYDEETDTYIYKKNLLLDPEFQIKEIRELDLRKEYYSFNIQEPFEEWAENQGFIKLSNGKWVDKQYLKQENIFSEEWDIKETERSNIGELYLRYGTTDPKELESLGWIQIEPPGVGHGPIYERTKTLRERTVLDSEFEAKQKIATNEEAAARKAEDYLVFTPTLDTSVIDRQLDDLDLKLKQLQDAQKDLNGEALISNLQQQLKLEDQIFEKKKEKIAKEKEYQASLKESFNKTIYKGNSGTRLEGTAFEYDSEGYITNKEAIRQTYTDYINDNSLKGSIEESNLQADFSAIESFIDSYNSSLNNTTKLTEEEYEYLKKIRGLEEDIAKAAADRTNATKAQLTALDKESTSLSKALETLGDASDYSGQTLINYNESYSKLLDEQTKNAEARQKVLAEEQSRLKEGSQGYLSDIGINLDDYKLEDGTYDIDAMAAKVDEMTAANKDNVQEVENINHAWKMGKYGVENLNKDIEEQEKLCDEVLKITKEQARVKWSTDFAQVNKELSDIETKLGRADKQLTRSKSLYDKQTTEGKIDMMSSYYGDIDAVDEYYDKLDSKLVEKAKTLGDKLQKDGVNMPSILKDYFSLDDPDEIFGNYNTFMENLEDTKDKILEETQKARDSLTLLEKENKMYTTDENGKQVLTEEAETLTKKIEDLGSAYEMLGTFAEEADRKEERALNKQPDMGAVQALSKEWKSAAVDREIKKVNRELTLLQKQQSRLKGKDVIANLQQQVAVIQKHIKLEQKKLGLMKSELKLQKTLIQGSIKRLQLESLGSAFDADGHVSATFLDALSKKSDIANDKLQDLISSLKEYESMMSEIESQEDVIVGLQDDISDKNYEIAQKIKEETRKAAEKALNQFKINLEIALDAAEAFRKIDRLQAKIDRLRETDWFNQSVLDYNDAISYATNDVTLLTDAVNKLIGDYNSGAWKDMYDTQKDARDDIMSYANQLMDAVQSYYDAIDSAKEKYASAIDSIISANQDLINDFERIKKYANQGINLTKLLPGGGNDKDIEHYYDQIDKVNKKEIDYLLTQKDYYQALLNTLDPLNQPDLFKSVKSAYDSIMEEIDAKTAESIQNYTEGLKESIERAARAAKQQIAELSGYASPELQQIAHDRQDQILKDYYDVYESEYEIASLANKYTKAISETDNLAHKKELTKVMQEQLKLLKEQAGEEKRLTKYEVDRANAVYELTLRQMALDEAKANKSQMRLRRDTQGNYRYEYVGDEAQTTDATQAVLDAQYKIYELDKNRLVELTKAKEKLLDDYTARLNEILDNQYMTTEQKEAAVEELRAWYLEQSQQLYENYAEAVTNINESSAGNLDDILQEMIDEVGETADEAKEHFGTIDEKIVELADDMDEKLRELEQRTSEAMEKIGGSIESVQDPIDAQIGATQELIDVDKELIDEWENQVSAMQNMLDMLASLESQYRALMEAALAAADAAARLQVTDFSTADERDSETTSETSKTSTATGGGSGSGSGSSDGGKHGKVWADWDGDTNTMYVDGASLDEKARATIGEKIHEDFPWADIYWLGRKKGAGTAVQYSYDTGGYTGEWGPDGRIAMLHQKELVLNAKDTENFLQATQILRTLQNNINQIQANVNNGFSPNVNVSAPAADLNQNVHIEANFPNVSNSREIEEAFNNLVNMASQRAMSTRR